MGARDDHKASVDHALVLLGEAKEALGALDIALEHAKVAIVEAVGVVPPGELGRRALGEIMHAREDLTLRMAGVLASCEDTLTDYGRGV